MKPYDVVIIGAGVVGSCLGRELSRYKLNIAILEKEEECGFGVSKSNSGIIHPGTQHPAASLKGQLCVRGNILIRKISRELGVDFKEVGELIIAFSREEIVRLKELKEEAESLGVPRLKIVDKNWLKINEPNLSPEAVAALYAPTAGIISPYRLAYDLCENAIKNGVEIYADKKVTGIIKSGGGFEIQTQNGEFKSRYVINAAGLFADDISGMVGVNDFKILPRKGEEFILDKKREHIANHLLFPLPSKVSKGMLVIKTADGNPMIGPTAEDVSDKDDLATSDQGLKKALAGAQKMIPSISENDIIAYFAGLRPVGVTVLPSSVGEDFIIRHEPKAFGFVNVAGIQSPGLTAAPAIAILVCDILRNNGLPLKKKYFFCGHQREITHLFAIPFSRTKKLMKKDPTYGDIVCRCEMVSAKEVKDAIGCGAKTLDGIKFRTRAQSGRCHGSFCTTRIMKILAEERKIPLTRITKRGRGSELVKEDRLDV
ncbi:MAG: NAD(P)/FAD-dependent oxidoreductase [Candidatus Omnitrophota bacterium]